MPYSGKLSEDISHGLGYPYTAMKASLEILHKSGSDNGFRHPFYQPLLSSFELDITFLQFTWASTDNSADVRTNKKFVV